MPTYGRLQPTVQYGRLGVVPTIISPPSATTIIQGERGPAGQDAPRMLGTNVLKDENENITLVNLFSDGTIQEVPLGRLKGDAGEKGEQGNAGSFFTALPQALPITVDENGTITINGNVIVEGDIQTSTESGQIIGDIKDTILEDIDGGTF